MTASYLHQTFFAYYLYICITVFVLRGALRYHCNQYVWKADFSHLLCKKNMFAGNNSFHVGIILLFLGHLIGLLTPPEVYHYFMRTSTKQVLAVIVEGGFCMLCFIGMPILLIRRLFARRIRATSEPSASVWILFMLYMQFITGLMTILFLVQHIDGNSVVMLAIWGQHVVTFGSDATDFIMQQVLIFKLCFVLAIMTFLLFPFIRTVHVFSDVPPPPPDKIYPSFLLSNST